jgi:pimeloyl-ACP methyl ester carboxylesterase
MPAVAPDSHAPVTAYLHGFASGPGSTKGQFFRARLAEAGRELLLPDLTDGDFQRMTITRELDVITRLASTYASRPLALIGSSLGGYVASLYAARRPDRVARLVLLAPAFAFGKRFSASFAPAELRAWRERGWIEVYHYGEKAHCRLAVDILDDASHYEAIPDVPVPTLVFHGQHDAVIDPALSAAFAAPRPNVERVVLDSDHELRDVLDPMWERIRQFL